MAIEAEKQEAAKAALREALAAYGGDTKNKVVASAVEKLRYLNPTVAPAYSGSLLESEWLLISAPNFPQGKQREDGKFAFTLGRLAFNLFQPVDLKVVIDRVLQPVFSLGNEEQRSHDIIVEFTTVDERLPKLMGVVRNLGVCQPISNTVLQVKFTGGILAPRDTKQMEDWKAVFGEQGSSRSWKEKLTSNAFRAIFGLIPPKSMNLETGEVSFTMHRSPKGRLEILYLDEELRITRGERGTILVCERQKNIST